jgi:hypothetical protein
MIQDESLEILFSNYLTLHELELSKSILFEIKKEKRRELILKVLNQPFSPKIHHFYFLEYLHEKDSTVDWNNLELNLLVSQINKEEIFHFVEKLKEGNQEEEDYSTMYITLMKDQNIMIVLLLENIFHSFPKERTVMLDCFLKEEVDSVSPYLYGALFHSMMKPENQRKSFQFLKYLKDEELNSICNQEEFKSLPPSFENVLMNGEMKRMNESLLSLYYLLNWSNYSLIFQHEMEIRSLNSNSIFSSMLSTLLNKFDLNQRMTLPMETFQYFNEHSMLKCLFHFHLLNKESLQYLTKKEEINLFHDYWNARECKQQLLTNTWKEDSTLKLNQNIIRLLENDLTFEIKENNSSTLEKFILQHEEELKEWKWKFNLLKELKRVMC